MFLVQNAMLNASFLIFMGAAKAPGRPLQFGTAGIGFFSHFAQSASVPPAAVQKWQKPLASGTSFSLASLPR